MFVLVLIMFSFAKSFLFRSRQYTGGQSQSHKRLVKLAASCSATARSVGLL